MPVLTGVGRRLAALRITLCALAAAGAVLLLQGAWLAWLALQPTLA